MRQDFSKYANELEQGLENFLKIWSYSSENPVVIKSREFKRRTAIIASTKENFDAVFKREYDKCNLPDGSDRRNFIRFELIAYVRRLIKSYKKRVDFKNQDHSLTFNAERFIEYLADTLVVNNFADKPLKREAQNSEPGKGTSVNRATKKRNEKELEKFHQILSKPVDIEIYLEPLRQITPPFLTRDNRYLGNKRGDIGVICGWFNYLQYQGVFSRTITRQQFANVLNHEFTDFDMGKDGSTFSKVETKETVEIIERLKQLIKP